MAPRSSSSFSSPSRQALRLADEVAPEASGQGLDLAGFAGTWVSSDLETLGVRRLVLSVDGHELRGRIHGAGAQRQSDWGEVEASAVYAESAASRKAAGFVLHFEAGAATFHVQANLKLGVAVLGVYRHRDGRGNDFFREFLALDDTGDRGAKGGEDDDPGAVAGEAIDAIDPRLLAGRWRNTRPSPRGLVEVELEPDGGGVSLRAWGAGRRGPRAWGEARGDLFACVEEDDVASAATLVCYDFGFMDCELQVRQNKGILAVTSFNRFHDGSGRSDYVTRELFHRT